jgi:membrane-bound lytic murein transglycosylase MltF
MATLTNNGDGTYTLTPSAREIDAVQRAKPENKSAREFMEDKITAWLRSLRDKLDERDAAVLLKQYEAATPAVQDQVDTLLGV